MDKMLFLYYFQLHIKDDIENNTKQNYKKADK